MADANSTGTGAPTQPTNVADKIDRHLKGERVTTEYHNIRTGERIEVPTDQEPPPGCVPMLGEVNANDVPVSDLPEAEQKEAMREQLAQMGREEKGLIYAMMRNMNEEARS